MVGQADPLNFRPFFIFVSPHLLLQSRCTKVFFPTEPLGNDQVLETRPVSLGWMDADFISEFHNSDFLQLCEFNNWVEADSMYTSNTSQYSSSMEAPSLLINEETLQNPNLFSIDSFLDSDLYGLALRVSVML